MCAGKLRSELDPGNRVLHLELAAPPGNILDRQMIGEIIAALDAYADRPLAAIVFEGHGNHFSYGASVAEHQRDEAAAMLADFHKMFRRLAAISAPTIAVVRGQCLGGGLELAAWCSWAFASPEARFGQPEIKLAVFPPLASILLPWKLGGARALDLCVSGRTISAAEAQAAGLIFQIGDDPRALASTFVEKNLLEKSASSLSFAERAVRWELFEALERRLPGIENLYLEKLMATRDANEGIAAFLERRAPRWSFQEEG